jgi:hypothetical protein
MRKTYQDILPKPIEDEIRDLMRQMPRGVEVVIRDGHYIIRELKPKH